MAGKKARVEHIDLLRALGIILMIMGHIDFGKKFDNWIHFFNMPMFFVISGYFYRQQDTLAVIRKRVRTLLLPYLFFGIFHLAIQFIRIRGIDPYAFYLLFFENTAGGGVPIAGALWFLTAMFTCDVIYHAVWNMRCKDLWKHVITAGVAVLGMALAVYLPRVLPCRLPYGIDAGMVGAGLYHIGRLLKEKAQKLLDMHLIIALAGIVLFSVLAHYNGRINMRTGKYATWPLFWVNAAGMTIMLWNVCRVFFRAADSLHSTAAGRFIGWLKGIGSASIVYLCLNQLAIMIAEKVTGPVRTVFGKGTLAWLMRQSCTLLVVLLILFAASWLLTKTKLKILVGKR